MFTPDKKIPTDRRFIDLRGQRFGRIVVIAFHSKKPNAPTKWVCKCDCGNNAIITTKGLREQGTKSCGCLQREATSKAHFKHGFSKTPIWSLWVGMIQRCTDTKCRIYPYYGGRGISVCQRWRDDFMAFYKDMGPRPSNKHSLEREDNDGNYEPGNVIWATREQQANNSRRNTFYEYDGKQMTLRHILIESKSAINYRQAFNRIQQGWSATAAVSTPMRAGNYHRKTP